MDAHVARGIVSALVDGRGIKISNAGKLEDFLRNRLVLTTQPYSSISPGDFPSKSTRIEDGYFYFDPTQLLSTRAIPHLKIKLRRIILDEVLDFAGFSSSEAIVREIARDSNMVDIMNRNPNPFALLGTLTTFKNTTGFGEAPLLLSTRPLLVLPGSAKSSLDYIADWEESRAVYEKEGGIMRNRSRISKAKFQALS